MAALEELLLLAEERNRFRFLKSSWLEMSSGRTIANSMCLVLMVIGID